MWRLVAFTSLIASVRGLADVLPNVNEQTTIYTDVVKAPWDGGVCQTGKKQSPINIKTILPKTEAKDPGAVSMSGFDQKVVYGVMADPTNIFLDTNKAVASVVATVRPAMISGGPLKESYVFSHAEFHWGSKNTVGSEHSLDGKFAPMEMQLVHYKPSTYADYGKAVTGLKADPAAVAVISFLFEIDTADNAALADIVAKVKGLAAKKKADTAAFKLSDLVGSMVDDYYYYDGSLTEPATLKASKAQGCLEIVKWIIATKKLKISQTQLDAFRDTAMHGVVQNSGTAGTSNTRAIQTNSSPVYHRSGSNNNIATIGAASILGVGTFLAANTALQQLFNSGDTTRALTNNPVFDMMMNVGGPLLNPPAPQERKAQFQPNHHHHPQDLQY